MIVKSRAMKKLCEYEGRPLPDDYKSDCWNDVDETEYACQVNILKKFAFLPLPALEAVITPKITKISHSTNTSSEDITSNSYDFAQKVIFLRLVFSFIHVTKLYAIIHFTYSW